MNIESSLDKINNYLDTMYKDLQAIYRDMQELYFTNGANRILDGFGKTIGAILGNLIDTKGLVRNAKREYDEYNRSEEEINV